VRRWWRSSTSPRPGTTGACRASLRGWKASIGGVSMTRPYGWNRTKPGEVVTEEDVYLGNVFAIWTFTIARFRAGQCEPPVSWGGWSCDYLEGKNTFQVVSDYQARPFVQKNGKAIISAIQALKKVA